MKKITLILLFIGQLSIAQPTQIIHCHDTNLERLTLNQEGAEFVLSLSYQDSDTSIFVENRPADFEVDHCNARLRYPKHGIALIDVLLTDPDKENCIQPGFKKSDQFAIFSIWQEPQGYDSFYTSCVVDLSQTF